MNSVLQQHGTQLAAGFPSIPGRRAGLQKHRAPARLVVQAVQSPTVLDRVELGKSGLKTTPLGVGIWSWGDRSGYWGYGADYGQADNQKAYEAIVASGITFIDTAEVYGFGKSEELLGEFMKAGGEAGSLMVGTKFAPLPWRFTPDSVTMALKASLRRMQLPSCGLYIQHWPGFAFNMFSNDAYLEGLARCKEQGLAEAIGVSNFNAQRLRDAHKKLQDRGVVLSSNQVQYSLLYRTPEKNGVLDVCRELGITLVAYSPLCQGLLTGKYTADFRPGGPRAATITSQRVQQVEPLIGLMREIGAGHGGRSPAQVAINWCIAKGALPIPGAKTAKQVEEIAGSLGWALTQEEVAALDAASNKLPTSMGAPFENW